jgi:hypothetical protein
MPLMMPDSTGPATSTVKRACDCCHKRKVKCIGDGTRPCKNCTAAGLTCTYNAIPQKKGPKGSRAKVISELRETQRQSQLAARARHGLGFEASQYANAFSRTPDLLSMELITSCVDYFFANMYPTQPILHRQKVGETIGKMENSVEAYCLVVSLCSYMLIQPNTKLPAGIVPDAEAPNAHLNLGMTLLDEAIRVRKGYDYIESPGIWSVLLLWRTFLPRQAQHCVVPSSRSDDVSADHGHARREPLRARRSHRDVSTPTTLLAFVHY